MNPTTTPTPTSSLVKTSLKFLISKETYSEILERAEQFEDPIKWALQSDESNEDMYEERSTAGTQDGEPLESDHELAQEIVVYQDRRQRRVRGNRYQDIIACLRWVWWPFSDLCKSQEGEWSNIDSRSKFGNLVYTVPPILFCPPWTETVPSV